MKKYKTIVLSIIIIIAIVIVGVLVKEMNTIKVSDGVTVTDKNTIKKIKSENIAKRIDITTDNWRNYFEIIEKTKEDKNAFGEITQIIYYKQLKLKDNICGKVTLEVSINGQTVGENTKIFKISTGKEKVGIPDYMQDYVLDDWQCLRIVGDIYEINISDDLWNNEGWLDIEIENSTITLRKYEDYMKELEEYLLINDKK
jgi:hypothetical protein